MATTARDTAVECKRSCFVSNELGSHRFFARQSQFTIVHANPQYLNQANVYKSYARYLQISKTHDGQNH